MATEVGKSEVGSRKAEVRGPSSAFVEYREKIKWATGQRNNEKKGDRELERKIRSYLLEEQHENFLTEVRKWEILAATNVKMSEREKVNNSRYDVHFLHKTCN